ncbi:ankyrin-2-like [Gigantopelta aegis]|uniref:ankyrin-2-like n=1 Tax=Gigantopelta aegis TaxID=1735272 RepID=UPI001B88758F|nr:ankyrin-2-like [Gigantopelta aegis]
MEGFSEVSDKRKCKVMTEKDLLGIAQNLGSGWQQLATELGLKQAQIEQQAEQGGANVVDKIHGCLIKWKQKSGQQATFQVMVDALKRVENSCTFDWELIAEVVIGEADNPDAGVHSRTQAQGVDMTCDTGESGPSGDQASCKNPPGDDLDNLC